MAQNMKDHGKMIYKMEKDVKNGLMDLNMLVNIQKDLNKAMELMYGLIKVIMRVLGIIILYQDTEHMYGLMEENTQDSG